MRQYRLTKRGRDFVRITSQNRDAILDFLYEHRMANMDEIEALGGPNARSVVRGHIGNKLIEEVTSEAI